jgi:hypothetical protein
MKHYVIFVTDIEDCKRVDQNTAANDEIVECIERAEQNSNFVIWATWHTYRNDEG